MVKSWGGSQKISKAKGGAFMKGPQYGKIRIGQIIQYSRNVAVCAKFNIF